MRALLLLSLPLLLPAMASAGSIDPDVVYQLANHPDGNAAPPLYGLRLDGLTDGYSESIFTFDFDHEQSDMRLVWDDDAQTIEIFGVAFGGFDTGSEYCEPVLWEIQFTYPNVQDLGAELLVTGPGSEKGPGMGTGSLRNLETDEVFTLVDFGKDTTFHLKFDHRDFEGVSGFGWLNHSGAEHHISASDWLFTVGEPVPEPGAALLLGLSTLALTARSARASLKMSRSPAPREDPLLRGV